jgi:hypothetical protein
MQPIVFKVDLFSRPEDQPRSQRGLLWLLESLCKINQDHLRQKPYPPLYEAGVRYVREEGTEEWLDIPHVISAGGGDCEDLACWRIAEIRESGGRAAPYVRYRFLEEHFHYHVLVQHYGRVVRQVGGRAVEKLVPTHKEDPSRRLGMGRKVPPKPMKKAPSREMVARAAQPEGRAG